MSDPFVLKLKHPITSPINKGKIETVTMRQPLECADFLAGAKASGVAAEMIAAIVARVTGMVPAEVEKLAYSDYKHLAARIVTELSDDEGKE
jgi:hypothetical protein